MQAIDEALGACAAFILVIGPRWVNEVDAKGRRRLDVPEDLARVEVASALVRKIRVIPVLVEGAVMPSSEDLPDDVKAITRRQAIDISDTRFHADMSELIRSLEAAIGRPSRPMPGVGDKPTVRHDPPARPPEASPQGPYAGTIPQRAAPIAAPVVPNYFVWSIINTVCPCPDWGSWRC